MFGLSFLSPWFLLGLAAAAGPLLLHLFARENAPVLTLPTMRFVPRAPVRQTRRRRLQDLLLLLIRLGAIVLLAVTFARPFFAHPSATAGASLGIIAVDRSFSMRGGGRDEAAHKLAKQALDEMPSGFKVALIAFDEESRLLVAPTSNRREIAAAIDRVTPAFGSTSFAGVVRGALDVAQRQPAQLVIVTDGQQAGVDAEALPAVPEGFEIAMRVVPAASENVSVDSLKRSEDRLVALVRNHGATPRRTQLRWAIDDATVASTFVDLPAGSNAEARLERRIPDRGVVAATIDDPSGYAADNTRYFIADPVQPMPILVVVSADAPKESGLYAQAALEASGGDLHGFAVTRMTADDRRLGSAGVFDGARAIVIVGTRGLNREAREQIRAAVEGGRGLVVAAGPDVEAGVVRDIFGNSGRDLGDGLAGDAQGQGLVATDTRHPVLTALGEAAGNLGQIRVERAWTIREIPGANTLLRYSSGRPALCEFLLGRGRVFLLTTDLARQWNTWPLHPTFVPFIVESVRYVSGVREHQRDVLVAASSSTSEMARPGVVTVASTGDRLAVNVDPRESRIETVSSQEFAAGLEHVSVSLKTEQQRRETEQGQSLWRYAALALLALLVVEGLVASRPKGTAPVISADTLAGASGTGGEAS